MGIDHLQRQGEAQVTHHAELEGDKSLPAPMQPGEDPASPLLEDAIHWVSVYKELVDFTQLLVEKVEASIPTGNGPAPGLELSHDVGLLTRELQRLKVHLAFWRERIRSEPR